MSTIESDPPVRRKRQATWRVAAADPRNEWRVTAAVTGEQVTRTDELAWQLSLTVRAQLGQSPIDATATEEAPGTWSVPPGTTTDSWRAQSPVARRVLPSATPREPGPTTWPNPTPPGATDARGATDPWPAPTDPAEREGPGTWSNPAAPPGATDARGAIDPWPAPTDPADREGPGTWSTAVVPTEGGATSWPTEVARSILPGIVTDGWRPSPPMARRTGGAATVTGAEPEAPSADAPSPEPVVPMPYPPPDTEHGDRTLFLALARQRLAGGIPLNMVHPPPPRPAADAVKAAAPEPVYVNLDRDDLLGTFARAVEEAGGVCHQVVGEVPDMLLDQLVAELDAWDVVVSGDPEAVALGERLADRGVEVSTAEREATAAAALGVTSAVTAIAATGSVVLDSSRSGGRLSSVLPPAHLCVVPVERLVATPGDVLRRLGDGSLPSSLVLVTGPSRTGDIEQLLTIGAHGPTALHVVVVSPPSEETAD